MNDELLEQCAWFISQFEGFRANEYICPAGYRTFGYGSLCSDFPTVQLPISPEDALGLVKQRLKTRYWPQTQALIKVPLNDSQKIALTSFCYNLGSSALARSTLLRRINRGDFDVTNEFMKWIRGGGRILKGLQLRRSAEALLFST